MMIQGELAFNYKEDKQGVMSSLPMTNILSSW
jgi:hypothetical protein